MEEQLKQEAENKGNRWACDLWPARTEMQHNPSLLPSSYYEDLKKQFKSNDKSYCKSQLPLGLVSTALVLKNHCKPHYVQHLTVFGTTENTPVCVYSLQSSLKALDLESGQRPGREAYGC